MFFQLVDVKRLSGVQGKFDVINDFMEVIGQMIQYDDKVEFLFENEIVITDDNLKTGLDKFKKFYLGKKEEETITLFKTGYKVQGIKMFKMYIPTNMHLGQIRDYLESKAK